MTTEPTTIDPGRVEELIRREEARFLELRPRSAEFLKTASQSLAGGVSCSWHSLSPTPMYGSRGRGSKIYDLDGNEHVDLHNGYGVTVVGHGHPKVVEAVRRRVAEGTHFAMPVEDTVAVAENLAERFGLPLWRFKNTGSEAVVDTMRIMRAATGRDLVVKVEGCYHGSGDSVAFSYWPPEERMGPPDRPNAAPNTIGIPEAFGQVLRIVPYNDPAAVERVLAEEEGRVAGMILEPIALNMGVVPPDEGYLAALREITSRHGVLLAFDEVKTGATIAYGGAVEWSGVRPDLVALAKAIGGGLPASAIGGTEEVMRVLVDGEMDHEGTFNGNPLSMAAARATLTEVLTPEVYPRFEELGRILVDGVRDVIERYRLPAHVYAFGSRGGVQFRAEPVRNLRDYMDADHQLIQLEWLFQVNRGVWEPASGDPLTSSVQHSDEDVRRHVENFEEFAGAITS